MTKPSVLRRYPAALLALAGYGPYRAVVDSVTDGDTVSVLADVGLDHYPCVSLRLRDVRAVELHTERGPEARAVLEAILPPGTPVVVSTLKDRQTFDRYVADVFRLSDDGAHPVAVNPALRAKLERRGLTGGM